MKKIFSTLFLTFLLSYSFGQAETFLELSNKLLCYAYDYKKTDSITYEFLKENFPYLTQPKPEGGRVMAPISVDATFSTTSLKFLKHPFFDYKISAGQLDFKTVNEPGSPKTEQGAKLILYFKTENEAVSAYTELLDKFSKTSTTKNISSNQHKKVGKFTGFGENNQERRSQIVLSKSDSESVYIIEFARYFWYVENF